MTERLIDTKEKQIRTDQRIRQRLQVIIDPKTPPPANATIVRALEREVREIDKDLIDLKMGQQILRDELDRVNCADLPAVRPFVR